MLHTLYLGPTCPYRTLVSRLCRIHRMSWRLGVLRAYHAVVVVKAVASARRSAESIVVAYLAVGIAVVDVIAKASVKRADVLFALRTASLL